MTTSGTTDSWKWRRDRPGLGVWEHRGKVAIAGIGHSNVDRRWDEKDMNKTLGAKAIEACERAMADAGVTKDEVDGLLCCPESMAGWSIAGAAGLWAPRPFFAPPYDSEDGLTIVSGPWLAKQIGLQKGAWVPQDVPDISQHMGMAAQAIGDKKAKVILTVYTGANLNGRYRRGGENASDKAVGMRAFQAPWGNHGGYDFISTICHGSYVQKYGRNHSETAPFVVNQHRNGHLNPWGFYTNHEPKMLTREDYLSSRFILNPLRLWDCDRPVHAVTSYLFTGADRAKDLRQKPVYVLGHSQHNVRNRSSTPSLDEMEAGTDFAAGLIYEASGLQPKDLDIFNPYDGFSVFVKYQLEAFRWKGVQRGEAHDFYKHITVDGDTPLCSGGGNLGNGRTRSMMYTDSIEQLRGCVGVSEGFDDPVKHRPLAGKRQVKIKRETAICAYSPPLGGGWLALGSSPN